MPETREARSLIDAAEQAAVAGDYTSAEQLLRHAALRQEADLGPLDPDLANTLNNLGVVCEITGKPADAEVFYERAYEIARAVLANDHPFVATSRKNLHDFRQARGRVVESPAPSPTPGAERESQPDRSVKVPEPARSVAVPRTLPPPAPQPLRFRRPSRPVAIALVIACGLLVLVIAMRAWSGSWFGSNERADSSSGPASNERAGPVAASPAATREPAGPVAAPEDVATKASPAAKEAIRGEGVTARPIVMSAQLCRALSTEGSGADWRCTPPGRPVASGLLFFYTRLKSATDTTVEHRWYQGDRLHQAVNRRIRANQSGGYRTNSRFTIDTGAGGNWRVELRTADGRLLHEERFVVR